MAIYKRKYFGTFLVFVITALAILIFSIILTSSNSNKNTKNLQQKKIAIQTAISFVERLDKVKIPEDRVKFKKLDSNIYVLILNDVQYHVYLDKDFKLIAYENRWNKMDSNEDGRICNKIPENLKKAFRLYSQKIGIEIKNSDIIYKEYPHSFGIYFLSRGLIIEIEAELYIYKRGLSLINYTNFKTFNLGKQAALFKALEYAKQRKIKPSSITFKHFHVSSPFLDCRATKTFFNKIRSPWDKNILIYYIYLDVKGKDVFSDSGLELWYDPLTGKLVNAFKYDY